jgi:hypothetical protein
MLAFQRTIYDDFLTGIGTVDLSSGLYDQLLGLPDELEVAITADQVGASTLTLTVIAEHSGDGRNWKTLGSALRSGTLSTTQTDVTVAAVTGGPALGNVRFNLTLSGSGTPARARVRILAGTKVVFVNSCLDPEGAASKASWNPSLVLHGAIMGAFNSAEWQDL